MALELVLPRPNAIPANIPTRAPLLTAMKKIGTIAARVTLPPSGRLRNGTNPEMNSRTPASATMETTSVSILGSYFHESTSPPRFA